MTIGTVMYTGEAGVGIIMIMVIAIIIEMKGGEGAEVMRGGATVKGGTVVKGGAGAEVMRGGAVVKGGAGRGMTEAGA